MLVVTVTYSVLSTEHMTVQTGKTFSYYSYCSFSLSSCCFSFPSCSFPGTVGAFLSPTSVARCMFSVVSVCLFVCLHNNLRMTKQRMMKLFTWRFGALNKNLPEFRMSRSKVKVIGDKKNESAAFCSGVILWGAVLVRHFFRKRSSGARSSTPVEQSVHAV